MPDILIRGYSMPASCATCHFNNNMFCDVLGLKIKFPVDYIERPGACPLHELQPHGDLIDVSKIVLEYGGLAKISPHDFVGIAKYFAKQIEGQPVVVPSERRKSGE